TRDEQSGARHTDFLGHDRARMEPSIAPTLHRSAPTRRATPSRSPSSSIRTSPIYQMAQERPRAARTPRGRIDFVFLSEDIRGCLDTRGWDTNRGGALPECNRAPSTAA